MMKLFVAPRFSKEQDLRLLGFDFIERVTRPEVADFIIVPQFVRQLDARILTYLESVRALCRASHTQGIVLKGGDLSYRFSIPGFTVFANSLYKSRHTGELATPAPIEDLSQLPFTLRQKGEMPVVSFCGYAGLNSFMSRVKYFLKNLALASAPQYRRGIYWRHKAMWLLARDSRIKTDFIIRDTFSGKSGALAKEGEREEYIESIKNADFVLCPKGDGNYSARFYETLALGRIPILVDTDMVLPLEKMIDYEQFIVRVPFTDLERIGSYVMSVWMALTNEQFIQMQEAARSAFQNYLRYDVFFKTALTLLQKK